MKTLHDRFWAKVDKSAGADACWPWTGALFRSGYGMIGIENQARRANRIAWQLTHGEIQPGLLVCHHCDNPPCVNPTHLFLGTAQDNTNDMMRKGRISTPRGDRHGSRTKPERRPRGDSHGSRLKPECRSRGERHAALTRAACPRGARHYCAKLTEEDVRWIRWCRAYAGSSYAECAKGFGVSQGTIGDVLFGRTWKGAR